MTVNRNRDQHEKETLRREKAQVEKELADLQSAVLVEVDPTPEEGDAGIYEQQVNTTLIAILEQKITALDAALAALDEGIYGTCTRCHELIQPERLLAKPEALLCIACQRTTETRSGRIN